MNIERDIMGLLDSTSDMLTIGAVVVIGLVSVMWWLSVQTAGSKARLNKGRVR